MPRPRNPQIAFVGWNPFQFLHVAEIAQALPGSYFVVEKRKQHVHDFDENIITGWNVPLVIWHRKRIQELDGIFDVIVCQTPFSQVEQFTKTRIAMIQYGYAKEPHNYGAWRALADLSLVYGPYAAERISPMCPVEQVGVPRLDKWHDSEFLSRTRARYSHLIDSSRKTVLYVPTWGDLSSTDKYLDSVLELGQRYNLLLKLHHITHLLEKNRRRKISKAHCVQFDANVDLTELLVVADIVLSDYSGAIFDAVYCRKPVVLLNIDVKKSVGDKISYESLEYRERNRIGAVVDNPSLLGKIVDEIATKNRGTPTCDDNLRAELFVDGPGAAARAAHTLTRLAAGEYRPTHAQSALRSELCGSIAARE